MTLNPKFYALPIISFDEFQRKVTECLLENYKNYELRDVFQSFLDNGCPKINKEDIGQFMKNMGSWRVYIDPVCVDIGDSMFYWLVSGGDAILVKYPSDK